MKITVKPSHDEEEPWYFLVTADNGEVVAVSETYHNKEDALRTARQIADSHVTVEEES